MVLQCKAPVGQEDSSKTPARLQDDFWITFGCLQDDFGMTEDFRKTSRRLKRLQEDLRKTSWKVTETGN